MTFIFKIPKLSLITKKKIKKKWNNIFTLVGSRHTHGRARPWPSGSEGDPMWATSWPTLGQQTQRGSCHDSTMGHNQTHSNDPIVGLLTNGSGSLLLFFNFFFFEISLLFC